MSAIVSVKLTTEQAYKTFIDVVQDPTIEQIALGENPLYFVVIFQSPSVEDGAGFDALQRRMEEDTPGSSAGLERAQFG